MRGRLTLAFVCLVLVISVVAGVIRAQTLGDLTRASELRHLTHNAQAVARIVEGFEADGIAITPDRLAPFIPERSVLTLERSGGPTLTVAAPDHVPVEADAGPRVRESVGSVTVSIAEDQTVVDDLARQQVSRLLALMLVILLLATLVGFGLATIMTRPFRRLAEAAAALGRGRFDIKPPTSRIPEVASIASSLRSSAAQLEDSLRRDREFFHHASHVLRTPLTGMRLELEELSLRGDIDDDARGTANRCLADIERLDSTVADLLDLARGRTLVAGAEVSLLTLGSHVAQRWRDQLPESRKITAYVDDGPEFTLTPGPVEQMLDSVLRDILDDGTGPVMLRFAGREEHVKVTVRSGPMRNGAKRRGNVQNSQTIAEVLGGRYSSDAGAGQFEILLPRR